MSKQSPPHQSISDGLNQETPGRSGEPPSTRSGNTDEQKNKARASHQHHAEDRLPRTWRSLASSVVYATGQADKVPSSQDGSASAKQKAALKEVDDAVVGFLRYWLEWGRLIGYLEAKLEGQAAEMESLQHYVRSQPGLRRPSRKRKRLDNGEEAENTNTTKS